MNDYPKGSDFQYPMRDELAEQQALHDSLEWEEAHAAWDQQEERMELIGE